MEPVADRWLAYWLLYQLFSKHVRRGTFANFRVIFNELPYRKPSGQEVKETTNVWNVNVPVESLKDSFTKPGGVFDQLHVHNRNPERPCNIYYGLNLRTKANKNKKVDILGFDAFYLDLDVNDNYTFEDRQLQITFWQTIGIGPSIVISSGRGLQAIWCLSRLATQQEGEPILKRMVLASETKGEGNVWDVTRIFRLPGFLNQKRWYKDDSPPCSIFYPSHDVIAESLANNTLMPRYAPEVFESFPLCSKEELKRLCDEAAALDGTFDENFQALSAAYYENQKNARLNERAEQIAREQQPRANAVAQEAEGSGWEPKYNTIPVDINDIGWPRQYKVWMRAYCKNGFDGLTEQKISDLKKMYGLDSVSASELDAKVMYVLVRNGYSKAAVMAFWQRPDLKLWRQDKMNRSPDYLDKTYDSMLESVRSIMDKNDPTEQQKQATRMERVTSSGYETWYWSGAKGQCVVTADLAIKAIYRDMDATNSATRDHYEIEAKTFNAAASQGHDVHRLLMQRGIFNSCSKFREVCEGTMCLMSDKNSHLSRLLNYLLHNSGNAPIHQFHSKMIYEKGTFVFPRLKITAHDITRTAIFELGEEAKKKFPLFEIFVHEPPEREEVRQLLLQHWNDLLHIYLPRVTVSVIGAIAAAALRARLISDGIITMFNLPTVNIRGDSHSGKTETVRVLYRLAGATKPDEASIAIRSTIFSINRMLEMTNFLPLLIDEFKEEKGTEQQIAHIREVVRRTYSGETILRGNADKTVTGTVARSSLIIAGEHELDTEGNIAEMTRVVALNTGEYIPDNNHERFMRLKLAPLWKVAPLFYQFIAQQDMIPAYNEFTQICTETTGLLANAFGKVKTRVGHNVSTLIWGCRVYDRFIKSIDASLPSICETYDLHDVLTHYMSETVARTGKMISVSNGAEGQTYTASRDELLSFLEYVSGMIQRKDRALSDLQDRSVFVYEENDERDELYIHMQRCHDLYAERSNYMKQQVFTVGLLRERLHGAVQRKEPWALRFNHSTRIANGMVQKVAIFKLSMLRDMGIWHPKIAPSENGLANEFGAAFEPKNRISDKLGEDLGFGPN